MSRADQLAEERGDLEAFLVSSGIVAEGIAAGEDPPDFYFQVAGERIALEHTTFYRSAEEPSRSAAWTRLRDAIDEKRRLDPLLQRTLVTIAFRDEIPATRALRPGFVEELVKAVLVHRPNGIRPVEVTKFEDSPLMTEYCSGLVIYGGEAWHAHWAIASEVAGFIGASEDRIVREFAKKTSATRPSNTESFWLLMVTGPQLFRMLPVEPEDLNHYRDLDRELRKGPFDVVWLFETTFRIISRWSAATGWGKARAR